MVTTNYPDGITNAMGSETFGTFIAPDPSCCYTFFDDFFRYQASATGPSDWLATLTNTLITAATIDDQAGGVLNIVNTAADNDAYRAQWQGGNTSNTALTMKFVAGKQAWFKARFALSEVIQTDFVIGLYDLDADPITAIANGVTFVTADGSAAVNLLVANDGTITTIPVLTVMAATSFIDLGWYYNGSDRISAFVNDVNVAQGVTTNMPIGAADFITPSFALQNGEAVAKAVNIDYIFAAFER